MKNVLMFLSQGVEDLEAVTIIDVLGWTNVRDNLNPVDLKTCAFHDSIKGKFGIEFTPTFNLEKAEPDYTKFDAFVLPQNSFFTMSICCYYPVVNITFIVLTICIRGF